MDQFLANEADIPQDKSLIVTLDDGRQVALFKIDEAVYALKNMCPHAEGPLGEGDIEAGCITCPWHGWQFNIKTGDCLTVPGENATRIPVKVIDGRVFLAG